MTQNIYKLTILRLDHRPYRDKGLQRIVRWLVEPLELMSFTFQG